MMDRMPGITATTVKGKARDDAGQYTAMQLKGASDVSMNELQE